MYVVLSLLPSTDLHRRVPSQVRSNLLYAVYNHFLEKKIVVRFVHGELQWPKKQKYSS